MRLSRRHKLIIANAAGLVLVLVAVPLVVMSVSQDFFGQYQDLAINHEELQTSMHADIPCSDCHSDPRGQAVYTVAFVGDFYARLFTPRDEPLFVDFATPARDACLACHETDWSHDNERVLQTPHPAHLRVTDAVGECVECHKWTAHQETYIAEHQEMPFSGVCAAYGCHAGTRTVQECMNCHHSLREDAEEWPTEHAVVVHAMGSGACMESCHTPDECTQCHTTGERPVFEGLPTEIGMREIERLHIRDEWTQLHGAVAFDDQAACMRCHVSDGECRACHARRPASHEPEESWISQHQEFVVDERRCQTCHEATQCAECHDLFRETD